MKLPLPRLLVLGLVALSAACPDAARPAGLSCYPVAGHPGSPMAGGSFICFETTAECDAIRALPSDIPGPAPEACRSSGPPSWHCFTMSDPGGRDPLGPGSTCLPTQAMCQASRPSFEGAVVSECVAAEHVYCTTGSTGGVSCSGEQDYCRRADQLIQASLPGAGKPRRACMRR